MRLDAPGWPRNDGSGHFGVPGGLRVRKHRPAAADTCARPPAAGSPSPRTCVFGVSVASATMAGTGAARRVGSPRRRGGGGRSPARGGAPRARRRGTSTCPTPSRAGHEAMKPRGAAVETGEPVLRPAALGAMLASHLGAHARRASREPEPGSALVPVAPLQPAVRRPVFLAPPARERHAARAGPEIALEEEGARVAECS